MSINSILDKEVWLTPVNAIPYKHINGNEFINNPNKLKFLRKTPAAALAMSILLAVGAQIGLPWLVKDYPRIYAMLNETINCCGADFKDLLTLMSSGTYLMMLIEKLGENINSSLVQWKKSSNLGRRELKEAYEEAKRQLNEDFSTGKISEKELNIKLGMIEEIMNIEY